MEWRNRIKGTLILAAVSFVIVSLATFLADLIILRDLSINIFQIFLVGFFSTLLLSPLFFWLRMKLDSSSIEATQLSDLELNERDIKEAVSNWVYIHYRKKVEGDLEFSRAEGGTLNCKVTVRNDS
ncbi:MAG: hypothetical protein PQJ58_16895 [Spirochaetales bacterium]|nr:hypothetical protein [Spirochaetales bacterium]